MEQRIGYYLWLLGTLNQQDDEDDETTAPTKNDERTKVVDEDGKLRLKRKNDAIKEHQEDTLSACKEYGQILRLKLKKDAEKQNNKVKTFNAM